MEWGAGFVLGWILGYTLGKNKTWFQLSKEEKRKRMPVLVALIFFLAFGVLILFLTR